MKRLLSALPIFILTVCAAFHAQGQPANDAFANAWTLTGRTVSTNGNSNGGTEENGEPNHAGFNGGRSVWFNWVAPANGPTRVDTSGSGFNTLLAVYTGTTVSALNVVASNDNGAGLAGGASRVLFTATQGTTYRIAVDGRNNNGGGPASGTYNLNLRMVPSVTISSPTNGSVRLAGNPILITAQASTPDPPISRVDFYRAGNLIASDPSFPYEATASNVPLGANSFFAVVTDSASQVATSAVVNVLVVNPGVTLVSPADGSTFLNTNPITVSAVGLLPSGSVTSVEFFVNGEKFGEDGSSPFSAAWNQVVPGAHRLTAIGKDNGGASYTSAPVLIAVAGFLVRSNSVWKYLDDGTDQGTNWFASNFNDSSWTNGPAELGYGDGDEATVVGFGPDNNNKYVTTYFRHAFVVTNAANYASLVLNLVRDDAAVVYLNGKEFFRTANLPAAPAPITYTTLATGAAAENTIDLSFGRPATDLVEGINVLAVEIHQQSLESSDISFNLYLQAVPALVRNERPLVTLTIPPNNAFFFAPPTITLIADASDSDGSVAKVEFFADGAKLGEVMASPYRFTWNNPPIGPHLLHAVATDDQSGVAQSAPAFIVVYDAIGTPLAQIISPANGTVVEGPTNILITATADANNGITNVEFYAGTTLIGTSTGPTANGLRADYLFQNSLNNSVAPGQALTNLGGNSFVTASVDGTSRTVLRFAQNDGVFLRPAATVIPNNIYSVVMLFSFDAVTAWRRLIDFKNATTDNGLYVLDSSLNFYPEAIGPSNAISPNTFVQVVLTRDSSSNVLGYVDGVQQFSFVDLSGEATLDTNNVLRFFRDDGSEGSAGAVARIRLYDMALSPNQVATLDRLPQTRTYSTTWNAAFGTNVLTAVAVSATGARGTSAPVTVTITIPPTNTIAPTIAAQNPAAAATVGTLASIQVVFSERVVGVNAGDLLINGVPATQVSGSGSNYTFTLIQPPYGPVAITWASDHGITDLGFPSNLPFDENGPGATWDYNLIDRAGPTVAAQNPLAGTIVTNLTELTVTFDEEVSGVDAADLLINDAPAIGLTGSGANYTFSFSQPPSGVVNISWSAGHGIADLAAAPNAFNATGPGATWAYILDARTILVQSNATWLFIKAFAEASSPIDAWRPLGFDDSSWSNAPAPFFYGDAYGNPANPGTLLSDMQGGAYSSIYLRKKFFVSNASIVTNLFLTHQIDDGFIAWINGVEVFRFNMAGGDIPYNGSAPATAAEPNNSGAAYLTALLPDPRTYLVEGTNVLAVHAFNNQPLTSSDFGFNAQLFTFLADPGVVPPVVTTVTPAAGDVFYLTNITVKFTEPVSGVDAGDLLVNGAPAASVSSVTNSTYTFHFVQPPYGTVAVTWATGHGIVDFDELPKIFDGAAPGAIFQYTLLNPNSPTVASQTPPAGATVNNLTQITVTFSEAVAGVSASDLLINGVPATGFSGGPSIYSFTFVQPPFGGVSIGWAANHGIEDLELPPNSFEAGRVGNTWSYTLVDQAPPAIAAQDPPAGAQVTNLTQISITFTEPVTGVNASDLRINGAAASTLSGSGAGPYTFTFPQPNATVVNVTWATAHGIRDLATVPNLFDATGPGATWSYMTPDTLAPSLASLDPPAGVTLRSLIQIRVTFTEPVTGVDTNDLLINGRWPNQVSGSSAGPYTFTFLPPSNGVVDVRWSSSNDITDLATPPNSFAGGEWTYVLDPNANFAGKVLINEIMFNPLSGRMADEWIELRNVTTNLLNLTGWRFTRGLNFTFPNVAIPGGGYLVVAGDVAAFQTKYPEVTNVIGGWMGSLANSAETLELATALGETVNRVPYASEGDWARRERGHGAQRVLNITRNGDTATVNVFGHGYTGNDQVILSGADQPEYNGRFTLSGVTASTFNITVSGTPPSPATGTILCRQVLDDGSSGWSWFCAADGFGSSLELVNPAGLNTTGQNWLSSTNLNGTPGRANSVLSSNAAPFLLDVTHTPAIPRSTDRVAITARVSDELSNGVQSVMLFYRDHSAAGPSAFSSTNMLDDGAHSDGVAADGLFGAVLPAQANGTIVEFYVQATDLTGLTRTWPAPALDTNGVTGQFANALFQVDDEIITNLMPAMRVVLTGTERAIFPPNNRNSDAEMNVTLISTDGEGTKIRYLGGVRVRGAGSRTRTPPNNRLNLPNDNPWNGLSALNLNGQYVHAQLMGSAVAQKSGLPASEARVIQYRINGVNPAPITAPVNGNGNQGAGYGTFLLVEPVNGDLAANLFPNDGDGNVYRASTGNHNADLSYRGPDPNSYVSTARGYFKTSNQTENDWTDLLNLTFAFSQVPSEADYLQAIGTNVNVLFWMRYFAVGSLINFGETSMFNGRGDDYALYRGLEDPRFVVIGHDFDTVFGQGDTTTYYPTTTNASIFIMLNPPNPNPNMPLLRRFMTNAAFAPLFFSELKRLADTVFHPTQLNPLMDQLLTGWGTGPTTLTIDDMKTHAANRRAVVLSQIPLTLTVNHTLTLLNGYPSTTTPSVTLFGTAHAIDTRKVLVNGSTANWSAWEARWTSTIVLQPGINRVLVQSLNSDDVEFARATLDIWYDDSSVQNVSGAIATDTGWTAANGPYNITANLTVNAGATLTIQPGTTVYLGAGVDLTVANGGRLVAEGTETARIRFTRVPGGVNWGGLTIEGAAGSPETRIAFADFEFNNATAIHADDGTVFLDHLTFGNTSVQDVSLDGSSFVVQDCVFPAITGSFEPVHGTRGIKAGGRGIFLRNFWGKVSGYNDACDFTGGNRPGPIVHFINNVFVGSDDDLLDLDSTDAWIEGNIFLHAHRNGSPDSASAISGGSDNANNSQITIIGNLIYDCDQAANAKQTNFYTLINNTIVHQSRVGSQDTNAAVVILADDTTSQGAGTYLEGNIIYDAENLTRNVTTAVVTFTNNIITLLQGAPWSGPGGDNVNVDPLFQHVPQFSETTNFASWAEAQVMRDWFSLRPGSPALGTGPNGRDKGGVIPVGASLSGEPIDPTPETTALLQVGVNRTGNGIPADSWPDGSGFTHYRWRLDGGVWSGETPITMPITLSGLANGPHYVEVAGKRDSGLYQDDPAFGAEAVVTFSRTWTVNTSASELRLNEVLAANGGVLNHNGTTPDAIEIYNAGPNPLDLSGVGLTDDPTNPTKFLFPLGTSLASGAYLVLYANNPDGTPGFHLGFNLNQSGDAVYLYDSSVAGGALLDSVVFGPQLTGLSVGRLTDGTWGLTRPTFGAANVSAPTGDPTRLRLNEWLALGVVPFANDFIEIYNGDPSPVNLGGLYLSDEIIGWRDRHQIAALSFISGNGYLRFFADSDAAQGPDHLNFSLNPDQGAIGFYFPDLTVIDCVWYQSQRPNMSQGRSPNGGSSIVFFDLPTPGAPNPLVTVTPSGGALVINEVLANNTSLVEAGRTPDWIELYNGTTNTIALGDFSLTDDTQEPRRFVLAAGTQLAPAAHLRVLCDDGQAVSTNNTGFALSSSGGGVYLFDAPANGGSLLSAIVYGIQTPNLSIGRVPDGSNNWVLTSPTPNAANAAVPTLGDPANLKVNEWLADPASGGDWFELYNPNTRPVALGGLHLTDDLNDRTKHPIAALSFLGTGTNAWLRFEADGNTGAGADHVNFSLRAAGEAIGIATASGMLINGYAFGPQQTGVSEGRFPDGSSNVVAFPGTVSPAASNYRRLAEVVINEVLTHTDEPLEDAIELHNLTAQPIDVGGWWLSDDNSTLQKYQIPSPMLLPAHGFLVIYETHFTNRSEAAFPFALSSKGDEVVLSAATNNALTGYRARVDFSAAANAVSFGRYVTSDARQEFVAMSAHTFGFDDPGTVDEFRQGMGATNAYPRVGPVVISEIMYHPPELGTNDNVADEFIELQNLSTVPVPLYDSAFPTNVWHLRDAVDFDFPAGTVLGAGEFLLVVSFDPVNNPTALAAFRTRYNLAPGMSIVGPYLGKLANDNDDIELRRPDVPDTNGVAYILVERVRYFDSAPWPELADGTGLSLQRLSNTGFGNDATNWIASTPTPGPQAVYLDSDSDGIPDSWEIANGLDPFNSQDAALDPDDDGLTNVQEYQAGTDPRDAQSVLQFKSIAAPSSGTNIMFAFLTASNQSYSVLWKESVATGKWTKLVDVSASATPRLATVVDPLPAIFSRIYRLATPQQPGLVNPLPAILNSPKPAVSDVGGAASFNVFAVGNGPLTYQWTFNSNAIPEATGANLIVTNVQYSHVGVYAVTVTDSLRTETVGPVYLAVRPRILSHPQDQRAATGNTVTFSVTAEGIGPLSYSWRHDNRYLTDQTNAMLILPSVRAADAGKYAVTVTHALSWGTFSVSSSNALLSVEVP